MYELLAASVYLLYFDASDTAGPRSASQIMQVFPAPTPRELDQAVPEEVRSLFHEAAVSEVHGALRAAAVMYRSSVEAMCKDLDVSGSNLYTKIEALTDKGLDRTVVDDLHEARMLGNDSIHDGLTYSADEVADVAGLIEEAFNVLYVQPAVRSAFRQKRFDRRNGVSSPSSTPAFPVDGHLLAGRSGGEF